MCISKVVHSYKQYLNLLHISEYIYEVSLGLSFILLILLVLLG